MATQAAVGVQPAIKKSSQTGDTVARLLTLAFAALVLLIAVILVQKGGIEAHDFRLERFAEGDLLTSLHPYVGAGEMR